ncbi:MAG: hypothetical protein JSU03_01630 [Bacteroidetes bacterium]|nr:hypothetical protein [Bacteroidota bacterium]MBS1755956.1 hypothetical protein [Bacteroidota bacterium]
MKFFETFTEIIGWIQIVAGVFIAGVLTGGGIYILHPTNTTLVVAIIIIAVALVSGICWATRIWKKNGTINFLSQISATPDVDEKQNV